MTTTTLEPPASAPADPIAAAIADIDGLPEACREPCDRATGRTKELVIVNWSGELDKVWPVMILSSTAAASGVHARSS